jgi:hypothetical protein
VFLITAHIKSKSGIRNASPTETFNSAVFYFSMLITTLKNEICVTINSVRCCKM